MLDYVGIRRKIIFSVSDNCVDGRASGSQSNWNTFAFWHYELFFFWVKGKLRRFLIWIRIVLMVAQWFSICVFVRELILENWYKSCFMLWNWWGSFVFLFYLLFILLIIQSISGSQLIFFKTVIFWDWITNHIEIFTYDELYTWIYFQLMMYRNFSCKSIF